MAHMEAVADVLQADRIVGVRLEAKFYDCGKHPAEFIAIGTASSAEVQPGSWRNRSAKPLTSDLSGQDFWTRIKSEYAPLQWSWAPASTTSLTEVAQASIGAVQNTELSTFTQARYEASELAMERTQAEAIALGADGIVGVQLIEKSHLWGSHVIEFFATGTAVRPIRSHQL